MLRNAIADGHRRARRALVAVRRRAGARGLPARHARQGLLRPQRRSGRRRCRPIRSRLVNPSTLIFSYTPVEDPAVYQKVWDGFIKHMEKVTGKKVVFFPVQSNAAQIEAMRSGRLHVAGVNAGGNRDRGELRRLRAVRDHGVEGRHFGYEMEIIVPADSPIKTPADLKGKKLAFTAPPRTPASRRRRRSSRPTSISKPSATSSRCSPASTTTRCSASPTRTTTPRRSPTR